METDINMKFVIMIHKWSIVFEKYLKTHSTRIVNDISESIIKFPSESTIYATLVGFLNKESSKFGGEFVNRIEFMFNTALKACKWEEARYILRFLANLVNCNVVSATAFIYLLHMMVNESIEFDGPQNRKDWFVYCVLSTLPWVGKKLHEKLEKELDHLLELIEIFIKGRPNNGYHILQVWISNAPYPQEDSLNCLWFQIRNLRDKNWNEGCIVRPYLGCELIFKKSFQHNLSLTPLPPHNDICQYPLPSVIFRMFNNTDSCVIQRMPDARSIERFLIEDDIHAILNLYKSDSKNCRAHLLKLLYKQKFPLKYCIIEVIFGKLFHLPTAQFSKIGCGSLLIELCNSEPEIVVRLLSEAVDVLFMHIDTMKVACVDRFINWFSYHLSNFDYAWYWGNWKDHLVLNVENPKISFIREVIIKCMTLSSHRQISTVLPKSFARFIPLKPEPDYKYSIDKPESLPGISEARELEVSINKNSSIAEILNILKKIPNAQLETDYNPLEIDVFVQTLLSLDTRSKSRILEFHTVFQALSQSAEAQMCILQSTFALWRHNQQMIILVVDELLTTGIVEGLTIVHWMFSNDMKPELTKMYLWEILNYTIRTMNTYVAKLHKELINNKFIAEEETKKPQLKYLIAEYKCKNIFLSIFQRFTMILCTHFARCDLHNQNFNTYWYKTIVGRLEQLLLKHHRQVQRYISKYGMLAFTQSLDYRIVPIYEQFNTLKI